jgi:TolA-binding protein
MKTLMNLSTRTMPVKGWCCCAVLLVGLAWVPANASASWFRNTQQEAAHLFKEGDYDAAAETFTDDYNRGVALYRAGRYTDAGEAFSNVEREDVKADALYNLGTRATSSRTTRVQWKPTRNRWPCVPTMRTRCTT